MDFLALQDRAQFIETYCHVFEHSPWVVERAWRHAPFAGLEALHAAFMAEIEDAGAEAQLALIRAHPELAANVTLTEASQSEQLGAGLRHLTAQEYKQFAGLNAAYREKFGFPFIICVRLNTKNSILQAFQTRLANDEAAEREEAIRQIGLIAKLRLQDLAKGPPK